MQAERGNMLRDDFRDPVLRRGASGQLRPCALRLRRAPILRGRSGRGRVLVMPVLRDYLTVYPSVSFRQAQVARLLCVQREVAVAIAGR
jgi:hypothetical protein